MAWQPAEEPLRQLAGFLNDSLNSKNPVAQKHAEQVRRDPWDGLKEVTSLPCLGRVLSNSLFVVV